MNEETDLDVRLSEHPVSVFIENNQVVDFKCTHSDTYAYIARCFTHPGARMVGELGFGTNDGVGAGTAINSHINERKSGIHVGFGQHNQRGVLPDGCQIHLDRGGLIWIDSQDTPIDLEDLPESTHEHPPDVEDEDVFSPDVKAFADDCCGVHSASCANT